MKNKHACECKLRKLTYSTLTVMSGSVMFSVGARLASWEVVLSPDWLLEASLPSCRQLSSFECIKLPHLHKWGTLQHPFSVHVRVLKTMHMLFYNKIQYTVHSVRVRAYTNWVYTISIVLHIIVAYIYNTVLSTCCIGGDMWRLCRL